MCFCTVCLSLIMSWCLRFLFLFSLIKLWPKQLMGARVYFGLQFKVRCITQGGHSSGSNQEAGWCTALLPFSICTSRIPGRTWCRPQWAFQLVHNTSENFHLSYSPSPPLVYWLHILHIGVCFTWFCILVFYFLVLCKTLGIFLKYLYTFTGSNVIFWYMYGNCND